MDGPLKAGELIKAAEGWCGLHPSFELDLIEIVLDWGIISGIGSAFPADFKKEIKTHCALFEGAEVKGVGWVKKWDYGYLWQKKILLYIITGKNI